MSENVIKISDSKNNLLPEFQKFLLEKKLVPDKKAPFYVHWVSRFLNYARDHKLSVTEYHEPAVMGHCRHSLRLWHDFKT